jgi:amino acid adenylation domain-containing protein
LPLDHQRPVNRSNHGDFIEFSLTKAQTKTLKSIAEMQGVSMFMLLLSLYNILLSKLTNQKDIVVGTPTSGRTHADVENMFGMFVNMLPIRNDVQTTKKFNAFLQEVKQKTLSAIENQEFQYEDIIEALDVQRDVNREALFDVVFTFRNFEESAKDADATIAISGLEFSNYYQNKQTAKFDLKLESSEQNDNLVLAFEYRTDIFKKTTIQRFVKYFKNIVSEISSNPHIEIGAIDVLSEADKKQLIFDFNQSKTKYPSKQSVDALFTKQASKTPTKVAVSYKDVQLTYEELENYSNQLANYLSQEHKVTKGDIIAIILERSQWLPVVTLAILKTGAAYLPLDPSYPQERIDLIKEESNFKVAVNEELLNAFLTEESLSKSITFNVKTTADDLAYIMYTSGSTGTPKAVMIPNKAIVRLVKSTNYFNFETTDKLISTGAFSFDATTFEYWGMLLNGGELILCDQDVLLQSEALQNEIRNRGVNVMWFTAGWGNQLIDDHIELFKGLETVLLGGEKLSPKHIQKLRKTYPALQIINGYGPTENTTFSLTYDISDVTEIIPIGIPISNSTAYILNDHLQLQPVGVVGEIYLGGDGLAKGYLNDPEKTAEKFIENPYKKGETIYKSGDLGMWLPDGNIRYMGRNDNQVKIRGHRIELGEIEQVLQTKKHIVQVVVTVKTINDDKVIIAYILSEEETINKEALKTELKQVLPEYMIPHYFVEVTEMPLNKNGKVAYKALPELQATDMILTEYVAASTETEKKLVDIWKNLLQLEKVGIKDNFFEIGGHSIKAIKMSHDISTVFELDVSIKNIFVHPTIEQLAAQIDIVKKQQEATTSNTELNEIEI